MSTKQQNTPLKEAVDMRTLLQTLKKLRKELDTKSTWQFIPNELRALDIVIDAVAECV